MILWITYFVVRHECALHEEPEGLLGMEAVLSDRDFMKRAAQQRNDLGAESDGRFLKCPGK